MIFLSETRSARIRLLAIVDILQTYTNASNVLSIEEICAYLEEYGFEATKRNVLADIKCINTTTYKIIYVTKPKKGYYIARPITVSAADALLTAIYSSQKLSATEREYAEDALKKTVGIPTNNLLISTTERVSAEIPHESVQWEIVMALRDAIHKQKRVKITYTVTCPGDSFSLDEKEEQMTVNPVKIAISSNSTLLVFTQTGSDIPECMHLCRIIKVDILNSRAEDFMGDISDARGFFSGTIIKNRHEIAKWVFLKFDCEYAEFVKNFFDSPVQLRKSDDGKYIAKVFAVLDERLIGWLLCFGDKIEIVAPKGLLDYFKERIKSSIYFES